MIELTFIALVLMLLGILVYETLRHLFCLIQDYRLRQQCAYVELHQFEREIGLSLRQLQKLNDRIQQEKKKQVEDY